MIVHGRCHCGSISYEAEIDPARVTVCHCTDCQMLTGSAYRASVPARRETLKLAGEPVTYIKVADSGNRRVQAFCGKCGTPVYSSAVVDPPSYNLRVGCLDERSRLPPRRQIWCQSAVPWGADLDDAPKMARE